MKKNNKLAAGLVAMSLPLMMVAIATPAANADLSVSSTVTAIDQCEWQMAGVPESLALLPEVAGAKYEGTEMVVTASLSNIVLGLSGKAAAEYATAGDSTECSFYNATKSASVTAALTGSATVVAKYGPELTADSAMNFDLSESRPLGISTVLGACEADGWTSTALALYTVDAASAAFGLPGASVENKYAAQAGERCNPDIGVSLTIKASTGAPAGAGKIYSFSGPSLKISKEVSPSS